MEQFKRAKVVMLPTNKPSKLGNLVTYQGHSLAKVIKEGVKPINTIVQFWNLYIISNDKIKVGDWVINKWNEVHQITKNDGKEYIKTCKKIIATTDIKLGTCEYSDRYRESYFNPLPQPSQQFIEKYIEEYNKGNIITDVLVEYKFNDFKFMATLCTTKEKEYILKINPKDNTITIKKLKEVYTKEELCQVLEKYTSFIWSEVGIHYPISLGIDAKDKFINSEL